MLSVVIPCYNEEEGIQERYRRLVSVLSTLSEPFKLVFIDDSSRDSTYPQLLALQQSDLKIVVVGLSRNFGHQKAVSAGLDTASGDGVSLSMRTFRIPPEVILQMYQIWKQGAEAVCVHQNAQMQHA
jgi:polyisoprenyl-phosphate glycosyltransferase